MPPQIRQKERQIKRYINLKIKGIHMENRQMKRYIDRKVHRMIDRQIGGKLDGKLDRQIVIWAKQIIHGC